MEPRYDVLILITARDFERLKVNYPVLVQKMLPRKLLFIGSGEVGKLIEGSVLHGKVGFINEDDILPFAPVHEAMKQALGVTELSRGITGWYYQQFLKMQYARCCQDEYYLVWDGDTVPCKPFSMFGEESGIPYLDIKQEYHEDYFITMEKLVAGMHKTIGKSFISEHMLMKVSIMKELLCEIEKNHTLQGDAFYEKIISAVGREKLRSNSFSEFETYGTYVSLHHMNAYRLRHWHSLRHGGVFFHPEKMTEEDYEWLSRDFDAISFEKGDTPEEVLSIYFTKKEYQEKISARRLVEVIQSENMEGYKEVWEEEVPLEKKPGHKDSEEYRIYEALGDVYSEKNADQAYLCYENAEFLCDDPLERERISRKKEMLKKQRHVRVRGVSFIIISYNNCYLMQQCIESIRASCPSEAYEIVVVDNASTDGVEKWLAAQEDIKVILCDENAGFPMGCNIGVSYTEKENDIFLLNNDTRMTHNALFWLRMGLYENIRVGAVGAISNYAGNGQRVDVEFALPSQYMEYAMSVNVPERQAYDNKTILCGFAMLIARMAWEETGELDEMFSSGYLEDTDYSIRLRKRGYELLVCRNSFIYHAGSQSFRSRSDLDALLEKNKKYLLEKWGYETLHILEDN